MRNLVAAQREGQDGAAWLLLYQLGIALPPPPALTAAAWLKQRVDGMTVRPIAARAGSIGSVCTWPNGAAATRPRPPHPQPPSPPPLQPEGGCWSTPTRSAGNRPSRGARRCESRRPPPPLPPWRFSDESQRTGLRTALSYHSKAAARRPRRPAKTRRSEDLGSHMSRRAILSAEFL